MSTLKPLPLSVIRTEGLQVRVETDRSHVDDLAELFPDDGTWPVELPPIVVFGAEAGPYYVGDGNHRLQAAQEAGCTEIPCEVHPGDKTAALWFACGANAAHGLRRTSEDKRNAVRVAYQTDPKLSDRAIAERCRVSPGLANYVLRPLRQSAPLSNLDSESASHGQESPPSDASSESLSESDSEKSSPVSSATPSHAGPATDTRTDSRGRQMNVARIGKGRPAASDTPVPSLAAPTLAEAARAFEALGDFAELDRHLSQAAKMLNKLGAGQAAELLRVNHLKLTHETRDGQTIARYHSPDLGNLRAELEHWRPHAPCPYCLRKINNGCTACKGLGWVTKAAFERCPAEARAAVRPVGSQGTSSNSGGRHA